MLGVYFYGRGLVFVRARKVPSLPRSLWHAHWAGWARGNDIQAPTHICSGESMMLPHITIQVQVPSAPEGADARVVAQRKPNLRPTLLSTPYHAHQCTMLFIHSRFPSLQTFEAVDRWFLATA